MDLPWKKNQETNVEDEGTGFTGEMKDSPQDLHAELIPLMVDLRLALDVIMSGPPATAFAYWLGQFKERGYVALEATENLLKSIQPKIEPGLD